MTGWNITAFECTKAKESGLACCLNVSCCAPCILGSAAAESEAMGFWPSCCAVCLPLPLNGLLPFLGTALAGVGICYVKTKIAEKYGIERSGMDQFKDCCMSFWCLPCSVTQATNEVMYRKSGVVASMTGNDLKYGFAKLAPKDLKMEMS